MKLLIGLVVALLVVAVTRLPWLTLGAVDRLELATLDARFSLRGSSPMLPDSADVVIVEIGEDSFRTLPGRYPWPRSYYARLIRNLTAAGAKAIGIDLLLERSAGEGAGDDALLRAEITASGSVVLAGKREQDGAGARVSNGHETYGNAFADSSTRLGLVNIRADADGVYRMYNPFFLVDSAAGGSRPTPTFAFALLDAALGMPPEVVPQPAEDGFHYAGRILPRYDAGSFLINYYGPSGTFPRVKFEAVIDDSTFTTRDEEETGEQINLFSDPEYGIAHDGTLKGKIVLVGVTVPEFKDLFLVSLGRGTERGSNLMYGVELHANVIQSVLRNVLISVMPPSEGIVLIVAGVVISLFGTSRLRGSRSRRHALVELKAFGLTAGLLALALAGAVTAFSTARLVVPVAGTGFAILGGYVASTLYHYIVERKQRLLIRGMFGTYVTPAVVDALIAHPESMSLGGRQKELTVLFSDVAGFTGIAERLAPEELVALLNEYMNAMSEEVFREEGTLDKFIGDAVMAFWGDPMPCEDHPLRACRCAIGMQKALDALNSHRQSEAKPPLDMRIGINTGEMVVGNMGGKGRFAYTVIGDSVNLASRLEGANKQYGSRIIIAYGTYRYVRGDVIARELDCIAVKGRSEPVTTYELLGLRGEKLEDGTEEFLRQYDEGIFRYRCREWEASIQAFRTALALRPDDAPSLMYIARCEAFRSFPPPADWDGVFVMAGK